MSKYKSTKLKASSRRNHARMFTATRNLHFEIFDEHGALKDAYNPNNAAFGINYINDFLALKGKSAMAGVQSLSPEEKFELIEYKWRCVVIEDVSKHFYDYAGTSATMEYDFVYFIFHNVDVNRYDDSETIKNMNAVIADINSKFRLFLKYPNVEQEIKDYYIRDDANKQAILNNTPLPYPNNDNDFRHHLYNAFMNHPAHSQDCGKIKRYCLIPSGRVSTMLNGKLLKSIGKGERNKPLTPRADEVSIPEIGYTKSTILKPLHVHFFIHSVYAAEEFLQSSDYVWLIPRIMEHFNISLDKNVETIRVNKRRAYQYLLHMSDGAMQDMKTIYPPSALHCYAQYFTDAHLTNLFGNKKPDVSYLKNSEIKKAVEDFETSSVINDTFKPGNNFFESDRFGRLSDPLDPTFALWDWFFYRLLGYKSNGNLESSKIDYDDFKEFILKKASYLPHYTYNHALAECLNSPHFRKKIGKQWSEGEALFDKDMKHEIENHLDKKRDFIAQWCRSRSLSRLTYFFGGGGGKGKSTFYREFAKLLSLRVTDDFTDETEDYSAIDDSSIYNAPVHSPDKTYDAVGGYNGEVVAVFEEVRAEKFGLDECLSLFDPKFAGKTSSRNKDKPAIYSAYNLLINSVGLNVFLNTLIKNYFKYMLTERKASPAHHFRILSDVSIEFYLTPQVHDIIGVKIICAANDTLAKYVVDVTDRYDNTLFKQALTDYGFLNEEPPVVKFDDAPFDVPDMGVLTINLTKSENFFDSFMSIVKEFPFACVEYTETVQRSSCGGANVVLRVPENCWYSGDFAGGELQGFANRGIVPHPMDRTLKRAHRNRSTSAPAEVEGTNTRDKIWQIVRRFGVNVDIYTIDEKQFADIFVLNYSKHDKYGYLVGASIDYYYDLFAEQVPVDDEVAFMEKLLDADDYYYELNGFTRELFPSMQDIMLMVGALPPECASASVAPTPPPSSSPTPPPSPNVIKFADFLKEFKETHKKIFGEDISAKQEV